MEQSLQVSSIDEPDWGALGVAGIKPDTAEPESTFSDQVMLDKNAFHSLFCGGLSAAGHMTGFQSLMVDENDGKAIACTQAIHDTIMDIPALHFILMPQNKWFERIIAIGVFTVPMAIGVKTELMARAEMQADHSIDPNNAEAQQKADIPDFDMSGKNERV